MNPDGVFNSLQTFIASSFIPQIGPLNKQAIDSA